MRKHPLYFSVDKIKGDRMDMAENIIQKDLVDIQKDNMLQYMMTLMYQRSIPDIRDGAKPVQMYILWSCYSSGFLPNKPHVKCAKIAGDVIANFHPHSLDATYEALCRLAQTHSMTVPPIDFHGACGSIDGSPAAAHRYCVTGDTLVEMSDGSLIRIDEIVKNSIENSDYDIDINVKNYQGNPVHASKFFNSGKHPIIKIKTKLESTLKGSYNHPVLCINYEDYNIDFVWKTLEELKIGDYVVTNVKQKDLEKHDKVLQESLGSQDYDYIKSVVDVLDNYTFEQISEINKCDEEIVYSIKVDSEDHSFITNGFISHNTEARLGKYGLELMNEIEKDAVDFEKNYDVTKDQPTVLPAPLPNILINSSMGIAGGYASSVPPHNVTDVCNLVCELIDNPNISVKEVAQKLVPDFPTGGILCSKADVEKAYITGQGSVKIRGRAHIVRNKNGTAEIVITEIPYMTTIGPRMSGTSTNVDGGLINSIVAKIKDGTIDGIKDIQDISDKSGICIKIFIKKDYDPDIILNQLYKFTQLESTYKIILVCKNGDYFKVYNIKEILTEWLEFRVTTIKRIITHDIKKAKYREHILEGLLKALKDIDGVISIIKKSNGRAAAKEALVKKYGFTELQVEAILDMKLSQLNSLDAKKLEEERISKQKEIVSLKESWKDENVYTRIKEEQKTFIKKYGTDRKTTIEEINTELTTEDIIADEDTLIVLTQGNYIKRVSNEFKTQKRGTQGVSIGDNSITEMFAASTKDHLLCFTNTGRVYDLKAYDIKESKDLKAKGLRIESYLNLKDNETVTNVLCINNTQMNDSESFLVFVTKNGMLKKTKLEEFNNIRSSGIIALMLKPNDELVTVKYIDTSKNMQDILLSTKNAQTVRYDHLEVKELGRNTYGVTGISLENNDKVTDACVIEGDNQLIFFATKLGLGKTVLVTDNVEKKDPNTKQLVTVNDGFPRLKRSATIKGRLCMKLKDDDELVSMVAINSEKDDLMIVTDSKLLVVDSGEFRTPLKRPTYGKKLVTLNGDDTVKKVIVR